MKIAICAFLLLAVVLAIGTPKVTIAYKICSRKCLTTACKYNKVCLTNLSVFAKCMKEKCAKGGFTSSCGTTQCKGTKVQIAHKTC